MRPQALGAFALAILLLTACAPLPAAVPPTPGAPANESMLSPLPSPTQEAQVAPSADANAATGTVYTTAGGDRRPMAKTVVRLASVVWNEDKSDGAFFLEGGTSPTATTDENGRFSFEGLAPGDYVIVVGDVYASHEIVSAPDGKARIFSVVAEGSPTWGDVIVSLAP